MRKKILLLCPGKAKFAPFLFLYLDILIREETDLTVVLWDKDGQPDEELPPDCKVLVFQSFVTTHSPLWTKIKSYIGYKYFIERLLKYNDYDLIISLQTQPAVLIKNILVKKYNKKYIIDYRDYSHEKHIWYKEIVWYLCKHSKLIFISSDAFKEFLPQSDNIYLFHNVKLNNEIVRFPRKGIGTPDKPIIIRYWGMIAYSDTNIAIIRKLANNLCFHIHFHGKIDYEAKRIINFCNINSIKNVFFHGEYFRKNMLDFVLNTDIIQNVQTYNDITRNAMSNKFYESAIYRIPQICRKGSYMGVNVEKYGLGIAINPEEDNLEQLLRNYYNCFDPCDFLQNCKDFLEVVSIEQNIATEIIKKCIME